MKKPRIKMVTAFGNKKLRAQLTYKRRLRNLDTFPVIEKSVEFGQLGFFHKLRGGTEKAEYQIIKLE